MKLMHVYGALLLTLALTGAGCALQVETGEAPDQPLAAPEAFDVAGYRWVESSQVTYAEPSTDALSVVSERARQRIEEEDHDPRTMSLELIKARLSPVMEFQGKEFRLHPESQERWARAIKEAAIAEGELDEQGLLDEAFDAEDDLELDGPDGRVARKLIGSENRSMVASPSGSNPYKMMAVYFGTNNRSGGTIFKACNKYSAMTVAHAMHNGTSWITRQNIRFGHSAANPSPTGWVGTSCWFRVVPSGWDADKDRAYDYAILGFRGNGATCTLATYDVGNFVGQTVGSGVSGLSGSVTGYPDKLAANPPPGAWTAPEMFTELNSTGATSSLGLWPTQLWHNNDTTDGQSGAPYWTNVGGTIRVRGIHWGYDPDNGTNAARRWNSTLDTFCSSGGF